MYDSTHLGVKNDDTVDGKTVHDWFDNDVATSGAKLGRAPGADGVPGFDLTFCAPKSVSLLWGLGDDPELRTLIDHAHQEAVSEALDYVSEHAGYTRRQDPTVSEKRLMIEKLRGISGVKYEHRTSRAGDPHVHSHVLLANKQLCEDGKIRTLDSKGIYHEARAAGMVYQATLREILSRKLGLEWGEIVNGCAEISGLDDRTVLADFTTQPREMALLQRVAAVRGRLSLCADQAAAAKWWLSMPMASVSAEGPMPKALSTRRTSPLMPGCRHQGRACPLRRARMTSNPLIVA